MNHRFRRTVTEALRNFLLGDKSLSQSAGIIYMLCHMTTWKILRPICNRQWESHSHTCTHTHTHRQTMCNAHAVWYGDCVCCRPVIRCVYVYVCLCVVCVVIWKEACSYRNSLLGFWRWANVQPMKTEPSSGRWFSVSSIKVSMRFSKNLLQTSCFLVSRKISALCVNSCTILWSFYIHTYDTCCWHGTWERLADSSHINTRLSFLGNVGHVVTAPDPQSGIITKAAKMQRLDFENSSSARKQSNMKLSLVGDGKREMSLLATRTTHELLPSCLIK